MNELDRGPAMTCDEVQEGLALLRRGGAGLTDWALLETHVRRCEACRTREQLQQTASAPERQPMARPPRYWLEKLQGESQVRMTSLATWAGPQLAIARTRSERVTAWLIQVVLPAAARAVAALAQLGSLLGGLGPVATRLVADLVRSGALAAAVVSEALGRAGRLSAIASQRAARIVMAAAEIALGRVPQALDQLTRLANQGFRSLARVARAARAGGSVLSMAVRSAALEVSEAGTSTIPSVRALGSGALRSLTRAAASLGHAAETLLAAGRVGVTQAGTTVGGSARLAGVAAERIAVVASGTTQGAQRRAHALFVSIRSVVVHAARPPILTTGTAMVGLVILVAATPVWWPRAWHVERVARPSATGDASKSPSTIQIARAPIDRKSAEAPVTAQVIRTARMVPSSEQLGPADTTAAPARRDHSPARSEASITRTTASTAVSGAVPSREAPRRQERAGTQRVAAEASDDASAAVDWLLGKTRARRQVEGP
jgi:hypothetical protein